MKHYFGMVLKGHVIIDSGWCGEWCHILNTWKIERFYAAEAALNSYLAALNSLSSRFSENMCTTFYLWNISSLHFIFNKSATIQKRKSVTGRDGLSQPAIRCYIYFFLPMDLHSVTLFFSFCLFLHLNFDKILYLAWTLISYSVLKKWWTICRLEKPVLQKSFYFYFSFLIDFHCKLKYNCYNSSMQFFYLNFFRMIIFNNSSNILCS